MLTSNKKNILFDFEKIDLNFNLSHIKRDLISLKEQYSIYKKNTTFAQEFTENSFCIYIYLQNNLSITLSSKSNPDLKKDLITKKTYSLNCNNIIRSFFNNEIDLQYCLTTITSDIKKQINNKFTNIKQTLLSTNDDFSKNQSEKIFEYFKKDPFLIKIINIEIFYENCGQLIFSNTMHSRKMKKQLELLNYSLDVPESNTSIIKNIKSTKSSRKDFIAKKAINCLINGIDEIRELDTINLKYYFKFSSYNYFQYYFLYCLYHKLIDYNEFDKLINKVPSAIYDIITRFNLTLSDVKVIHKKFYGNINKSFVAAESINILEPLKGINNNILTYKILLPNTSDLSTLNIYNLSDFLSKPYKITIATTFPSKFPNKNSLLELLKKNKTALAFLADVDVELVERRIDELEFN